jgi:hypothetical protein
MSKKKNKSNKKVIFTDWKDWAGVSPVSPEMQLIKKVMGNSGDFSKLVTTAKDFEKECNHVNSMTVITHILYLPGEVLIERKCEKCGFRQIRLERHENSDIHYLTKWINCGNYTPWEVDR